SRVLLTQLVVQAAVNMGVVTALLPPKGISHPFISYGGSSLLVSLLSIGMILSLTRVAPQTASMRNVQQSPKRPQTCPHVARHPAHLRTDPAERQPAHPRSVKQR